jgi:hypothetical protein
MPSKDMNDTHRNKKKSSKKSKDQIYSQKHVRQLEELKTNNNNKNNK